MRWVERRGDNTALAPVTTGGMGDIRLMTARSGGRWRDIRSWEGRKGKGKRGGREEKEEMEGLFHIMDRADEGEMHESRNKSNGTQCTCNSLHVWESLVQGKKRRRIVLDLQ